MTQKERLVELLTGKSIDQEEDVDYVADYLLENGVIVPPCKVGDTVYKLAPVCKLGLRPSSMYCEECIYNPFNSGETYPDLDVCGCHYQIEETKAPNYAWIIKHLVEAEKPRVFP